MILIRNIVDFSCSGANLQTLTNRQAVRFVFAMAVKKNPSSLIIFFFKPLTVRGKLPSIAHLLHY